VLFPEEFYGGDTGGWGLLEPVVKIKLGGFGIQKRSAG